MPDKNYQTKEYFPKDDFTIEKVKAIADFKEKNNPLIAEIVIKDKDSDWVIVTTYKF